ncbi:uncharacterized protein LOC129741504 [Uranotaenia lowii]|uniref:uncharacterized protein LOC129741504 n=1 Tax=Uranotaenia lowii TaxID=190385 RepID=UPI002479DC83|nr:uncharacterized protein LOC129741504 [Uranotaenia lowii]
MSDSASTAATAAQQGKSVASRSPKAKSDTPLQLKSVALGLYSENGDTKQGTTKNNKEPSSERLHPLTNKTPPKDISHSVSAKTVVNVGHSCGTCKSVDNSRMVQCNDCDEWNHFSCVGVKRSVESKKWNCAKCRVNKKKAGATRVARNTATAKEAVNSKPEKTSGVKKTKTSSATKEMENWKSRKPVGTTKPSKAASVKSVGSRKSAKEHLELQLRKIDAEQTLLEEKKKLMEKHFSILEELVDLEDEEAVEEEVDADTKVQSWLGAAGGERNEEEPYSTSEEEDCENDEEGEGFEETDSSDDSDEKDQEDSSDDSTEDELDGNNDYTFNLKGRSTPAKKGESKLKKTTSNRSNHSLTRNQLAARHVVAKDLPIFSGNPEE